MKDKQLWILLIISLLVRAFIASAVELGNDEVYYRIFGLFPDWSYFDHPPLTAWLISLTTLSMENVPEIAVRLGSIIIGTINTYLIYKIAGGERSGTIAALLYTGSIYASVILGTFILPDTPLSLFWLLTLWVFMRILPEEPSAKSGRLMLSAGVLIGLAMLSKYTGAYLWGAAGLYILLFNRRWFARWELWVAAGISIVMLTPVVYWNIQNHWISFTFHGARVAAESSINWLYFGRELMGGVFYNNPINFILIICAVIAFLRKRFECRQGRLLLVFSLPMILLFLGVSLTRETLPHWAAPAYFALIILTAHWLTNIRWAYASVALTAFVMVLGYVQINFGLVDLGARDDIEIGRGDFTLDMYGWKQGGDKFAQLHRNYVSQGLMPSDAALVQYGWDDAAHVDTYFGLPLGLATKTIGDTVSTHYYEWINTRRGGFNDGEDVYLVSPSRYFFSAEQLYADRFREIYPADTIKIFRSGKHVCSYYVYRMKGYMKKQDDLVN